MTTNMGSLDRMLRAIAGLVLLYLSYTGMFSAWAWVGYAVGAVRHCGCWHVSAVYVVWLDYVRSQKVKS
mgnify:CR=1 FL=1